MSDLQDRLEQLAQRGTPRGGDAVIESAKADVSQDLVTAIPMEAPRSRNPRRHFGSMIAAAGVAATLFVSMLAFSAFMGAGSGADSPEGAVIQLADAVSNEDPLAAADVLAPDEVRSLSRTVDTAARRAQELQLARTAAAPLAGLDLSVDNLDLTTETLADGYVKVTVTNGTLSAGTEKDKFSPIMQRVLRDADDNDSGSVDLAGLAKGSGLPTFVIAVERDGHWYVSAAYTTLEYIREANDLPPAELGSGIAATSTLGAASPDEAVGQALRALSESDWEKLISLAPPDEIPVYDYREALIQLGEDTATDFTIDDLSTATVEVDGDQAKVKLTASGTTESGSWSLDGACFQPPYADEFEGSTADWCGVGSLLAVPFLGPQSDEAASATISVVRKDGRWFVSPVGTVLDLVDLYLRDITQRQFYTLLGVPQELPADGELTLGQPVTPPDPAEGAYVYTLDAHQGDRLLGLVTEEHASDATYGAGQVLVYGPDGEILENSFRLIDGRGLVIPADGTYKFVVRPYYRQVTFTVWDAAQAPEAALHPPEAGNYEGCKPTGNGGVTCSGSASTSSSGFGSDPIQEPVGSGSDSGPSVSESCVMLPDGATECTSSSSSSSSDSGQSTTATTFVSGTGG